MIKNLIKKAISTLDRKNRFGQCQFFGTTTKYDAIHPYGFLSKTKKGSLVLCMSANRDESNVLGIEYDNKLAAQMSELLEPGEVALYHPEKMSYIIFKNNGDLIFFTNGNAQIKLTHDGKLAIGVSGIELLDEIETVFQVMSTNEATFVSTVVGPGKLKPTIKTAIDTIISNINSIKGSLS